MLQEFDYAVDEDTFGETPEFEHSAGAHDYAHVDHRRQVFLCPQKPASNIFPEFFAPHHYVDQRRGQRNIRSFHVFPVS